ncbi:MAG TPA: transglutaminase-like domain-containing protein [Anaerolineae bacterium]|nr:transglutaminase-like domain-containing protein [Anaerolineae bacterium]HQJ50495.1 transglutaminase-like domain-containing protein [Anaerolineae bacterium]
MTRKWRIEEGWATLLLLTAMLLSVVWAVRAAEWTDGLGILQWIALMALLVSLVVTQLRRFPALLAWPLLLVAGVLWIVLMLSLVFRTPLVPEGLVAPSAALALRVRVMLQQMWLWVLAPAEVETWLSNFMFISLLAALTWLLTIWSTWALLRWHWVWGAIIPAGAACLVNIYYGPPRLLIYLVVYLLSALLLVVRMHVYLRQRFWRMQSINYNLDVDLEFLRDGLIVSSLVLALAWTLPVAARSPGLASFWTRFQDPWNQVQERWNRIFTSLNYQGSSTLVQFGKAMTLGGAVNLGNTPVMEVECVEPSYWQAVSYDHYTGSGWVNSDQVQLTLQPAGQAIWRTADGQEATGPGVVVSSRVGKIKVVEPPATLALPFDAQRLMTYTIHMVESGENLLFVPGQVLAVSQPSTVLVAGQGIAGGLSDLDVSMVQSNGVLRHAQSYSGVALVSTATAAQLRNAGSSYPRDIRERYLTLPRTLPERVRTLAREITAGATNPYDRALAIQTYLRGIQYDQYIAAPPAGSDVVDWFLFENRRGYCDYYATAMAVLCRAIGIPARVAQGYSPGEFDSAVRRYIVRQLDAHAWPLVYFPDYGWIKFEPTASEPTPGLADNQQGSSPGSVVPLPGTTNDRSEDRYGPDEAAGTPDGAREVALVSGETLYRRLLGYALALAGVLLAGILIAALWWCWQLRGLSPAARAYEQMRRLSSLAGARHQLCQTPAEFGESLGSLMHRYQDDIRFVVSRYVQQRFSRAGLSEDENRELAVRWQRLRWHVWAQALTPRFGPRRRSQVWISPSSLRPPTSPG